MSRTNPRDVISRIERLCTDGLGERQLRVELLAQIARVVPHDAYAFLLTDPVSCVGASPLADIPGLPYDQLPSLIRAKYLTTTNRWTSLSGIADLARSTEGSLEASRVWREVQHQLAVTDVASMVLRDRHGCWGLLDLWRTSPVVFDDAELAFLRQTAPLITLGVRQALARTFTSIDTGDRVGPVVLLLGDDLTVRSQTPATDSWLRVLNPPEGAGTPIPAQAYNVAAQLLAQESAVDDHPPWVRAHLTGGRWLSLRAARLGTDIAVSIEDCTPGERVELFGLVHGMSDREREVLDLLCGGANTREIARRLIISEHTAHDHVRAVLRRADVGTRQILLSRALGSRLPG